MKKKGKRKRRIWTIATSAIAVLGISGILVSCANLKATAGTKYIGPRTTIRIYTPGINGNPYANQPMWFTNPDQNYALTTNIMGTIMNDSSRNPLIRPVNIGVPNQVAKYNSDPTKKPTNVNEGKQTRTYFKFGTASSVIISYTDVPTAKTPKPGEKEIPYNSDATPAPWSPGQTSPGSNVKFHVPYQSINSNEKNVIDTANSKKTFSYIMQNKIITNIAITIRSNAYWSTNTGQATNHPITPADYWYGLQNFHLSNTHYRSVGTGKISGGINNVLDSEMNHSYGGQVVLGDPTTIADNWATSYTQYNVNTIDFKEGNESKFTKNNSVNIPFKNSQSKDGWDAWNGLFINQQLFPATSVWQTTQNRKNFSKHIPTNTLTSKYGYYANNYAAASSFSNILFGSEFSCESLYGTQSVYHRAKGYYKDDKIAKNQIQNVIWSFSKQVDTFPETQYEKYLQGSTTIMDKYSLLSDHTKNVINVNRKTMGVHYDKNIFSQVSTGDTTWGSLIPGNVAKMMTTGIPYYNNGYTEAMFGETLQQTLQHQKNGDYFKHYYTYGTALRSSLSAAINWYTSSLNFNKGAKSNWGSSFAPNMVINGKSKTSESMKGDIMSSEYSYSYDGTNFSKPTQVTRAENKTKFAETVASESKSFQSAKYAEIKNNIKITLDAMKGYSFIGDNRIMFELPVRAFHNSAIERTGLRNMQKTLNSLDPRIHVVALLRWNPATGHESIEHENYDYAYKNNWTDQTLPRLESMRSPTQSNYIRHTIPNTLMGLGGFFNDMLKFNQFGTLVGFSEMIAHAFTPPSSGNIKALYGWVNGQFKTTWNAEKSKILKNKVIWIGVDSKVKDAFKEMDIKNFHKASSQDILGKAHIGENYAAFTTLKDKTNKAVFNAVFSRLLTSVTRGIIKNMTKNNTVDQIKSILAGMDSYFGRSLGWMGRRMDNEDALPVSLQKTWYKVPKSISGVQFSSDAYVE